MNNKEIILNANKTKKIYYRGKAKIVDLGNEKYVIRLKSNNTKKIYEYLENRRFNNFLNQYDSTNKTYEIYPYITERKISKEDKAIDLIYTLSFLHIKTTTYQNTNLDKVKEIYEENLEKLNYLNTYYYDLQDYIESKVYMSPSEYLLIRNISKVYRVISFSKYMLEKWYKEKEKTKKERLVLLHNNISLDHFLEGEDNYLINWDKAKKGIVVYDFINFYKNEYLNLEMSSLFEIYQSKYQYTKDEYFLFLSLLSIPWKIDFKKSNYINTLEVNNLIKYIDKVEIFNSKENEKYQKAHQEKLNK